MQPMDWLKKIWPVLVSLGGASVMVLAFFIPSIQDQWDRYQARKIIEQYEELGNEFFEEERYKMAEEAYAKAFELSEQKRLDVEVKRLHAKINRIYNDPAWGSAPEDLQEVDFQFLLHFQKGLGKEKERISILNSYGVFLASEGRTAEARKILDEAILANPGEAHTYINLGNLLDQLGKKEKAEAAYLKAISLDPEHARAYYNLGLLYLEQGKLHEAENELSKSIELDSTDLDAIHERDSLRMLLKIK